MFNVISPKSQNFYKDLLTRVYLVYKNQSLFIINCASGEKLQDCSVSVSADKLQWSTCKSEMILIRSAFK